MATVESLPPAHARVVRHGTASALTSLTPRHVTTAMWVMVVVQLGVRAYASGSGYLSGDDFVLQSRAARLPFPSVEFLLTDHDGHLMPAAMAVAWLTTRFAPLSPLAVTASLVALQLLASAAVVMMLRRVFGVRPLVLVPLAVYLFSPLTLPSFLWWSAALNALPLQAGLAAAIWSHVGYLRTGRLTYVVVTVAAMVTALSFYEKAVVIGPALLGVTWVLESTPGLFGSLWAALRRHWRLWVLLAAVTAGYLAGFLSVVTRDTRLVGSPADVVTLLRRDLLEGVLPATIGGPLSWDPVGYASALAAPPAWLVVLAVQVAVLVVGGSWWARPRARRAWLVLLAFLLVDVAEVADIALGGGGTSVATLLPLTLRYAADAAVLVAFTVGVALMAPRGTTEPRRARKVRAWLSERPTLTWATVFVVADAFVLFCLISTTTLTGIWSDNPARPWVENAKSSLAAAPVDVALLPEPVPESVLYGLAFPDNLTSNLLGPVLDGHRFGRSTTALTTFDGLGHLVPGQVDGARTTAPPAEGCWPVRDGHGVLRLDEWLAPWEYTVHLGYSSGGPATGTVAIGAGRPEPLAFQGGEHDTYVRATGGGSVLYVALTDPDTTVCVQQAAVGGVVPDVWGAAP